jgi:hypothetical protein
VKKIMPIKCNPNLPQPNNYIIEVSFKTLRWGKNDDVDYDVFKYRKRSDSKYFSEVVC